MLKQVYTGAKTIDEVVDTIREELKNFGGAIIAVSHDRKFIQKVFDDIYLLNSTGLHRDTIETK